ncbi:hypothetical protein ON058_08645 [Demequina sp. B12]|uniref:hypothetical protein n=1 Tax=Demequina sp. B12 TaxID=2992757 RepID=UPI00237B9875|nr:hypothetical protein [Demequina sp. B12]MDE0573484.1 hypothetical protein [Demequina sp. B12]
MGHVLHVWEGKIPSGRDEAIREFYGLACEHLMNEVAPPTPAIRAFLLDLLDVWPERPSRRGGIEVDRGSPWKWPASTSASGPVWRCQAVFPRASVSTYVVAAIAERHGLAWHDPQPRELQAAVRPIWEAPHTPLFAEAALPA